MKTKSVVAVLFLSFLIPQAFGARNNRSKAAYSLYTKGVEQESRKHYTEAVKNFEQAIELNPAFVSAYVELARAMVMQGKRKEGLEKIETAMKVARQRDDRERLLKERNSLSEIFYTNETFQRYQTGLNYMKLDRVSSAAESLEKALSSEPDNVLVLLAYAQARISEENQKEAEKALESAIALNEGNRDVRIELADLDLAKAPEKSLALVKPLLSDRDVPERAVVVAARAYSALNKNRDAIDFLQGRLEKKPDWLVSQFWLAKFYSMDPKSRWMARKTLMTFLKRANENLAPAAEPLSAQQKSLKALKIEADALLVRVNQSLE